MDESYWIKQAGQPSFGELLWSRPENKRQAGKLLIVGGNAHGFAAPAAAYQTSLRAGVGVARVVLPDALRTSVGQIFETGDYAPSTPSGSFSQLGLATWLEHAAWADATLLAGEFGRNSETAIVLEKFLAKHSGAVAITRDAVDYYKDTPEKLLARESTLVVCSMAQLQKLAQASTQLPPIRFGMDLIQLVTTLHTLSKLYPAALIVKHLDNLVVAVSGQVSTTKLATDKPVWRVETAAAATVWWLQNPNKTFEALTTAILQIN